MRISTTLRAALAAALLLGGIGTSAEAATPSATPASHCVVTLHPVGSLAPAVPVRCYATLAELSFGETGGQYTLADNPKAPGIVEEILAMFEAFGPGESIIGVAHDTDWVDETLTFKATNTAGCTTGYRYEWEDLDSEEWNDKMDAMETFTGCVATVFEHRNFGGVDQFCPCETMTVMEDEVSSVKFYGGGESHS